jgi:hypothetical protein
MGYGKEVHELNLLLHVCVLHRLDMLHACAASWRARTVLYDDPAVQTLLGNPAVTLLFGVAGPA